MSAETPHKKAGVIGNRIGPSKSPLIHGFWLAQKHIPGAFERIQVTVEELPDFMKALPASGLCGINVTIPHKQAVIPFCHSLTPLAARIGAVNTIIVQADGSLLGHNTDIAGFCQPLRAENWSGKTAVVIGNGGAARAVLCGLQSLGFARIRVMARRVAACAALMAELGLDPAQAFGLGQSADALEGASLLVNASSLGMIGNPELDLDLAPLAAEAIVNDIVYTPLETGLLRHARARGLRTIDGLEMLIGQAEEAFALFFGVPPERSALEDAKLRALLVP